MLRRGTEVRLRHADVTSDFPRRTLDEVRAACRFMASWSGPWWVGGGWAIDQWVGGVSRDHEDIEICVPRTAQKALRELVADWLSFTPKENRWVPLVAGELLEYPASMWQLRHSRDTPMPVEGMPPRWDFLLNEVDGDESIFALDERIRLPLHHIIVRSSMEIPVMAPEVVLLHKAFQQPRPKDDHDFLWVIDRLSPPQRGWLATHLRHLKPDHRWLPKLA